MNWRYRVILQPPGIGEGLQVQRYCCCFNKSIKGYVRCALCNKDQKRGLQIHKPIAHQPMPASPSHTITTSPARTAKFFSRISRKSIKATESQPHYSRLKLEGAIHSKLVDNRLLYDGAPLFHLALYQTQYPGLSFFITYQFDVHQFWRVLFHVLDHFLIEGIIDIIHSPFLATVLL